MNIQLSRAKKKKKKKNKDKNMSKNNSPFLNSDADDLVTFGSGDSYSKQPDGTWAKSGYTSTPPITQGGYKKSSVAVCKHAVTLHSRHLRV